MNLPELLAPAGTPEALDAAVAEGADAVYLGLKNFNARMRSSNFAYSQFEAALKTLRRMGRKLYVTVNTVFEEREADRMYQLLKYLAGLDPDGILVQDFGIITMVRENFPSLKLHASTQMNIACSRAVNLLSRYGFSRAVLARELSLEEIKDIRKNTNMELEVFIHGALCMSVSGLCLFSSYLGGKSANRGMCAQACRRFYTPEDSAEGAYFFSPGDLQLIEKIPDLCEAGVNSFKIEGRMKSAEYVGTVVSAYRLVLDSLESGTAEQEKALKKAGEILCNDFAREKTVFLFNGNSGHDWLNPEQNGGTGIPLGRILKVKEKDIRCGLLADSPVLPVIGDTIRLHRADDSLRESHKVVLAEEEHGSVKGAADIDAVSAASAASAAYAVSSAYAASGTGRRWVSIPEAFRAGDSVYLIQTKAMTKRYPKLINIKPDSNVRGPGRDRAPPPKSMSGRDSVKAVGNSRGKNAGQKAGASRTDAGRAGAGRTGAGKAGPGKAWKAGELGEGMYVQVSRMEDLYVLQSQRPVKVIISYSHKLLPQLTGKGSQVIPFGVNDMIIFLDPFMPQGLETELAEDVNVLLEKGFRYFILNNPGQFSFFRNIPQNKITLIAGPWLYAFNSWALSFLTGNDAGYFISPFENNRQNLERTLSQNSPASRRQAFITVFSRPSLFRIRGDLRDLYKFKKVRDNQNEGFMLATGLSGSSGSYGSKGSQGSQGSQGSCGTIVYPERFFYIADKIPFLREAGFRRFILDMSAEPVKKTEYRELMKAAEEAAVSRGASRFNWKDGFYKEPEKLPN